MLNAIYEADFLGLSYGFREKRKPHDALDALAWAINRTKVNWILDADIKAFFDNLDHTWLLRFIRHRVADRRMLRLLTKWLKSGWVEKDQHYPQEKGVPQGAVISPLLANIYLHYVLDLWTHQWRSRTAKGRVVIVRYADDFVAGFELATEAQMYLTALTERLAKFGLTVHPDKTRLIEFGRFAECNRRKDGVGKPETFDFLGFTHICSTTRNGKFFLRRLTSRKRMKRKLDEVKEKIRARMHRPVNETGNWLRSVLIGHQNYFGVPGNQNRINEYYIQAVRYWHWCLGRRSQKGGGTWAKFERTRARLLPRLKVVHPFPEDRCDVRLKARAG